MDTPPPENTPPQVDKTEVAALLAARQITTDPAPQAAGDTVELPPGTVTPGGEGDQKAFAAERDRRFDASLKAQEKLIDEVLQQPGFTKEQIALTESEKEAYVKAVMMDIPFVIPIKLKVTASLEVTLLCSSRNNFESTVIFRAIQQEMESKRIPDFAVYTSLLHRLSVAIQLKAFNGAPTDYIGFETPIGEKVAVDKLISVAETKVAKINAARWKLILQGLALFEAKQAIASTSLVNGDFSQPAG